MGNNILVVTFVTSLEWETVVGVCEGVEEAARLISALVSSRPPSREPGEDQGPLDQVIVQEVPAGSLSEDGRRWACVSASRAASEADCLEDLRSGFEESGARLRAVAEAVLSAKGA